MKNLFRLFTDTKEFLSSEINRVFVVLVFLCLVNITGFYMLNNQIEDCTNKVHFRYYNLTKSLEDIHNVQIDTRDGRIIFNPRTIIDQLKP